jgi:hypothetical protein
MTLRRRPDRLLARMARMAALLMLPALVACTPHAIPTDTTPKRLILGSQRITESGCAVWVPGFRIPPQAPPPRWDGACVDKAASGNGTLIVDLAQGRFTYTGGMAGSRQNGQGRAVFPDGNAFEGTWKNGVPDGPGSMISSKGDRITGFFAVGQPLRTIRFARPDGSEITGDPGQTFLGIFDEDFRLSGPPAFKGPITLRLPDGTQYDGTTKNNSPDGTGTLQAPDGRRYVGRFANGRFSGEGVATWPDGTRLEGAWRDGQADGEGTLTAPDGTTLTGTWQRGCLRAGGRLIALRPDPANCP